MFGYSETFTGIPVENPRALLDEWNKKQLELAIFNATEAEETKTFHVNNPKATYYARTSSTMKYPNGKAVEYWTKQVKGQIKVVDKKGNLK